MKKCHAYLNRDKISALTINGRLDIPYLISGGTFGKGKLRLGKEREYSAQNSVHLERFYWKVPT